MIEVKVNLNSVGNGIDMNTVASEITSALQQFSDSPIDIKLNMKDDSSMSPIGLYSLNEQLRSRNI